MVVESAAIIANSIVENGHLEILARCATDVQVMFFGKIMRDIKKDIGLGDKDGDMANMGSKHKMNQRMEGTVMENMVKPDSPKDKGFLAKAMKHSPDSCKDGLKALFGMLSEGSELRIELVKQLYDTFAKVMAIIKDDQPFDLPPSFNKSMETLAKKTGWQFLLCTKSIYSKFISVSA